MELDGVWLIAFAKCCCDERKTTRCRCISDDADESESKCDGRDPPPAAVRKCLKNRGNGDRCGEINGAFGAAHGSARCGDCLLYTSPSPRDRQKSRMPSSA